MKLILNDQTLEIPDPPADQTLLNFVREQLLLTGTKEGCASGDCGACTLMVGELNDGRLSYQTVNACIVPLGAVANQHVVTVEYLSKNGLHPAQQAMLDHHGSQCGFCTPGFVMSLANFYEQQPEQPDRSQVLDAISGNLCRCTGYRPIVDAGLAMFDLRDQRIADDSIVNKLNELSGSPGSSHYHRPTNLEALRQSMSVASGARLIAGGTDLVLESTQLYKDLPVLIDLSQVQELQSVTLDSEFLTLGSVVTYSRLEQALSDIFPRFCQLLKRLGSRQIRNRGTLGGNIANGSPIADTPPVMLAFDAVLDIENLKGELRELPVSEFYLGYKQTALKPDEYIRAIKIPIAGLQDFHRFYKVSKRMEDDISSVMLAMRLTLDGQTITSARIAFGGMAATPVRAADAEAVLIGKSVNDQQTLEQVKQSIANTLKPLSDVRASDQYRLELATNLIEKVLLEARGQPMTDLSLEHWDVSHA